MNPIFAGCSMFILMIYVGLAQSAPPAFDDFDDNQIDLSRWRQSDQVIGAGLLSETNAHLEFTTAGQVSSSNRAVRTWLASAGSYISDWSVSLNVTVGDFVLTSDHDADFGIEVFNNADPGDRFDVVIYRIYSARQFFSETYVNNHEADSTGANTSAIRARLMIRFDAGTKTLYAQYDASGNGQYTVLASADARAWDMNDPGSFGFAVLAKSDGEQVPSGRMYGDDFVLVGASSDSPRLFVRRQGGTVAIQWMSRQGLSYIPQMSVDFESWTDQGAVVSGDGTMQTVTAGVDPDDKRFYRLKVQ